MSNRTDIVDELLQINRETNGTAAVSWAITCSEAAGEIIRLRAENEKLRGALRALAKHSNEMEAQNHDYHTMGGGCAPCISEPLANAYNLIENDV